MRNVIQTIVIMIMTFLIIIQQGEYDMLVNEHKGLALAAFIGLLYMLFMIVSGVIQLDRMTAREFNKNS